MEHAILGAGAIGGLVGTALASLGENVTVLVRPERLPGYPANLSVERPSGTITAPAKAAVKLTKPVDVLWIATKTYQLETALAAVQSLPRCIVPLLNGVDHVEMLRAHFDHDRVGDDRVLPATIAVEAEKIAPGRFVQRSPFVNLNLAAGGEPLLGAIVVRLRDLGFTCRFIQNEQTLMWSKLCFLGPFALVTSASGLNKGEVYANAEWKRKLISAIAEACAVAKAGGAEVDAARIQAIVESSPSGMQSSMQKDLAARRQLELDAIGGPIVRGGERYGIDVSTVSALIAVIRTKAVE
ncbi:MAG TPA: ketopantoate reductase family protein [Terriglobales bacterium]|nr:ketopantoate reductase family protein [Terriglobales bacterium]